jgi:hypothetical protein
MDAPKIKSPLDIARARLSAALGLRASLPMRDNLKRDVDAFDDEAQAVHSPVHGLLDLNDAGRVAPPPVDRDGQTLGKRKLNRDRRGVEGTRKDMRKPRGRIARKDDHHEASEGGETGGAS